ncbi:MAG: hypothetical protein GX200_09945 [Firmicutes bacterium]|nr:hypothetical protein [Bacillota bacterium]
MNKIYALLCGIIIVLVATFASITTGNPSLFYKINEWAFFILLFIITILIMTVTGNNPAARRKRAIQLLLGTWERTSESGPDAAEFSSQPVQDKQDKSPDDWQKAQKENIRTILLLLLAALPPMLAVLVKYYIFETI